MRRLLAVLTAALVACTGGSSTPTTSPPDPDLVAVAEELCPMLWQWQLTVGSTMNEMSAAAYREPDPEQRRLLYAEALERTRSLIGQLRSDLTTLSTGPYVDLLTEEILNGAAAAEEAVDQVEGHVRRMHASAQREPTYNQVVPHVFLKIEKVIDLAKPELAGYHDAGLIKAFLSVPQCQHGVKDANDGIPRHVPAR